MKILVVEDEKEISDGIKSILIKEGYYVDTAYDGNKGLEAILGGVYDLILLDIMLPSINGLDVLKTVRQEKISTPIIILTAKSQTEDKILGLDLGADDYLTKPFDKGELLARIRARVRKSLDMNNSTLEVFNICLDASTYKLSCNEKSIKLSSKEYQFLEYLMLNRGIILSKEMIAYKIWGADDETSYNNIEVYVSFLRKKLKFVNAKATIVTKKGVGYYLEEASDG